MEWISKKQLKLELKECRSLKKSIARKLVETKKTLNEINSLWMRDTAKADERIYELEEGLAEARETNKKQRNKINEQEKKIKLYEANLKFDDEAFEQVFKKNKMLEEHNDELKRLLDASLHLNAEAKEEIETYKDTIDRRNGVIKILEKDLEELELKHKREIGKKNGAISMLQKDKEKAEKKNDELAKKVIRLSGSAKYINGVCDEGTRDLMQEVKTDVRKGCADFNRMCGK